MASGYYLPLSGPSTMATGEEEPPPSTMATGEEAGYLMYDSEPILAGSIEETGNDAAEPTIFRSPFGAF
jgi:hypothetical protein